MLRSMIQLLLAFINQLSQLEKQIDEIAKALPEVTLVKSIPGIGNKVAAALVAEMGDSKQFQSAKQLVAFAGLDPSLFSSGKFTATRSPYYKTWLKAAAALLIRSRTVWIKAEYQQQDQRVFR